MRILFSVTNLDLGGAQMFVMRLAEELSEQGHEVFVYNHNPEWSDNDFQNSFSKKVKVIGYNDSPVQRFVIWKISGLLSRFNKNFSFRNWLNLRCYQKVLIKNKIEVINSQMFSSDKVNAAIVGKLNIPFIITTHGEYELNFNDPNKPHFEIDARKCLDATEAVIYTAEKNIEAIRSILPVNKPVYQIIVGFNGDSIKKFSVNPATLGIKPEDFVIGMVARGIPEKGWIEVMKMFHILYGKYTKRKLHLILIGNGDALKKQFSENRIDGMHLLQFTKNPMEYFSWIAYFNVGVLLSYFQGESVPNAVIEYLYHGLPVIATPMGDIKKMISSPKGMAGEMIPLKDGKADYEAAANVLLKWLNDPALFNEIKSNTNEAFEKFSMKNIALQYLNVYKETIAKYTKGI